MRAALRGRLGLRNVLRAGPLGALLDLEGDLLSADKAVEVQRGIQAVAVKEVFLLVIRCDEAESAIGNDLLDGTGGHIDLHVFSNERTDGRAVSSRRVDHTSARHRRWRVPTLAHLFDKSHPSRSFWKCGT